MDDDDAAIVIYTSGSSSKPKAVPLMHYAIIENGFHIGERQGYMPNDRLTNRERWSFLSQHQQNFGSYVPGLSGACAS